jgi:hypothetical protein
MCEFCGSGPECGVCGRGEAADVVADVPPPPAMAEVEALLASIGYAACDLDSRGLWAA